MMIGRRLFASVYLLGVLLLFLSCSCKSQPGMPEEYEPPSAGEQTLPGADDVPRMYVNYPSTVDEQPALITVNIWFLDNAPVPGFDTAYIFKIEVEPVPESDFVRDEDAVRMLRMQESLMKACMPSGLYAAGVIAAKGKLTLVFYGKKEDQAKVDSIHKTISEQFSGLAIKSFTESDPKWAFLFSILAPDAKEWQWILDRKVVEQIKSKGDSLTKPRTVDHTAFFPSVEDRAAFKIQVEANGFQTVEEITEKGRGKPFGIHFSRPDLVDLNSINAISWALLELAAMHNGLYDGWGCPVVKE